MIYIGVVDSKEAVSETRIIENLTSFSYFKNDKFLTSTEICESIEKSLNLNADIIVVNNIDENMCDFSNYLNDKSFLLINSDNKDIMKFMPFTKNKIITYGLNAKSSVTISSVTEGQDKTKTIQCCIQRNIPTMSGKIIPEQEFGIKTKNYKDETVWLLAIMITALIADMPVNILENTIL